ncbi:MAG: cobalamin biosynthesis protein CbiX [Betaproteobacteria bacterium]|nr:cobalamin biosynthesis protein CbiX [Betaproteobacteria bacterium]
MKPTTLVPERRGIVLFGHGSRDPLWRQPIEAVARQIKQDAPDLAVQCAYLELCQPDLGSSVQALLDTGVNAITILPMFLGVGKHAREDLPKLLEELRLQHPHIGFFLRPAIGKDPAMVALMARLALAWPER